MKKGRKIVVVILFIITILMIGQMGRISKEEKNEIQIGDYVAYDPTFGVVDKSKLTYTSPTGTGLSHGNGCDFIGVKEQIFTANNRIKWRILGKDEQTGAIILISDMPIQTDSKEDFELYGAVGYLYAEQELNEICKIYGYGNGADTQKVFEFKIGNMLEKEQLETMEGSGARSINIEDINKITTFNSNALVLKNENFAYKYGDFYTYNTYYPTITTKTGKSESAKKRREMLTAYKYDALDYIVDPSSQKYKILFGEDEMYYWVASRGTDIYSDETNFTVRIVNQGTVDANNLCDGNSLMLNETSSLMPIRPIVYLKPNIHLTKKDENGEWIINE